MSTIQVNGQAHPIESPVTVTALLLTLGLADKPVVVELDGKALLHDEYGQTMVLPGASLEIITLAAGG